MTKELFGYIINKVPYKENDIIVSLLTKDSIESFKIRGGLKVPNKHQSYTDLFSCGKYTVYCKNEGDKFNLKEGELISRPLNLYNDFKLNTLLSFLAESIIKDPEIKNPFELFDQVMSLINNKYNFLNIILVILKYHLFYNGSLLESDKCVKCGKNTNIVTVSFNEGGYICEECNKIYHLSIKSLEYLKAYRYIMKASILDTNSFIIDKSIQKELLYDIFNIVEENTGLKFNSKVIIFNIL